MRISSLLCIMIYPAQGYYIIGPWSCCFCTLLKRWSRAQIR